MTGTAFPRDDVAMKKSAVLVLSLFALAGCGGGEEAKPPQVAAAPKPPPPAPAPTEVAPAPAAKPQPTLAELEQKTLKNVFEALNAHEAKKLAASYTENAVVNVMGTPSEAKGRDAIAATYQRLFDAFSSFKAAPSRMFVKGDVVVVEWAWTGTHSGDLFGVKATEKPVGTAALDVLWFTPDGAIKESHVYYDMGTVMSQIGKSPRKARPVPTLASSPQVIESKSGPEEAKNAELAAQMYGAFAKKSEADFTGAIADDLEWDELAMPETAKGKEAAKKWFAMSTSAWTDPKRTTSNQWTFGDWVVSEGVFTGKHTGKLGDIAPTKKDVSLHTVDVLLVKDGKVQKGWSYGNGAELMMQLGLMPMPGGKPGKPGEKPATPAKPVEKADKPGAPKGK